MPSRVRECLWFVFACVVTLAGTDTPVHAQSVTWLGFEPRVVDPAGVTPTTLTVQMTGSPATVQVCLAGGGIATLSPLGGNLYTVEFTPAQMLSGHTPGDEHNFVGFLEFPPSPVRVALFANVLTAAMTIEPVHRLANDVQVGAHVVNIRDDGFLAGAHVPAATTQRLYDHYDDSFDFIGTIQQVVTITNRSYRSLRNDVQGIGIAVFDNAIAFGSPARLQGTINYPIEALFDLAETASLHEIGHRWINFLDMPELSQSVPHWPLSDLARGIMGFGTLGGQGLQFPWQLVELPGGDYQVFFTPLLREYSDVELYLMGLVGEGEVGPHFVFDDQNQTPQNGGTLFGPVTPVTIQDIVAAQGPRIPTAGAAPTDFTYATVVLSRDRMLSGVEMAFFNHMSARGEATVQLPFSAGFETGMTKPFLVATGGRGTLTTTLPVVCGPDNAPDNGDGTFGDGQIDVEDLLAVLATWGVCPPPCPQDGDGDGNVDVGELLAVLAAWGACF